MIDFRVRAWWAGRTLVATVAVAAMGATGAHAAVTPAGGGSSRGVRAGGAPRCAASVLKASLGKADPGAGTTGYPLTFVNKGKTACVLGGYPRVSATAQGGRQIGRSASHIKLTARAVRLAPGQRARAWIGVVDPGNFDRSRCRPVTAAAFRVVPPHARRAVR